METAHFTSGGGRMRPVANLSVPVDAESLDEPFPLTLTPLRGGGVEDAMSMAAPFIVVMGKTLAVGNSVWRDLKSARCLSLPPLEDSMLGAFRPTAAVSVGLLWFVYASFSSAGLQHF